MHSCNLIQSQSSYSSFPEPRIGPDSMHVGLRFAWIGYASWSQQKNDMRMRKGYPVLLGQYPALGGRAVLAKGAAQHEILAECGISIRLTADNGTGRDLLLNHERSYTDSYGVEDPQL